MRFAFAPGDIAPGEYSKCFELSKKYGFKGVNVNGIELYAGSGEEILKSGLQISQMGVWDYNPLIPEEKAHDHVIKCIDAAASFGFKSSVTFGAGGYAVPNSWIAHPDNWTRRARKAAAENIRPLAKYAEKKGVSISLEPHTANVANNIENTLDLLELIGVKNVGITLDIVNYCTVEAYYDTTALIDKYANGLRDCIIDVHIKDVVILPEMIVYMKECSPGLGNLNLVRYLEKIDEILKDDAWAIVEHVPAEETEAALDTVLEAARTAGVSFK